MSRTDWATISKDPEIWKKVAIGGACLTTILPAPIALGMINSDLEAEVARRSQKKSDPPQQFLTGVEDIGKLVTSGIGPAMLCAGALLMFAIATIPLGLSYFQLYAFFRPANELVPELHAAVAIPFTSVILYFIIGALGLAAQAVIAASFPVALAQYSRGQDLAAALSPVSNILLVVEMGVGFWRRALGVAVGMLLMTIIFITGGFGLNWLFSTLLCFAVCSWAFVSLALSSRYALEHIIAELPASPLPLQE